ncbi:MAG: tetratricopeptide repeat protein [Rhodocyclaceae bacterium]|jgi:tetratricopeptide (TPR) repeat protein|nr:tetratricopeptide repeat protein [Rhodocyclaceae bacterium]
MRILIFIGFLALSMLVPAGLAQASPQPDLQRAEALIRSGKAEEAWKLLSPLEFELAGREDYDYWLGVAALDSGRADRATLIFERVLAVNPDHAAARLDMARAYYALGDFQRAKTEFEQVSRHEDTPPAARQTIDRYLAAINENAQKRGVRLTGYLEAALGRDSNLNSATSANTIFVPLFNTNFTLGPNSQRAADNFLAVGGGAELTYALSGGFSLFAGIDLKQRMHRNRDTYDAGSADYRAGFQAVHGKDTFRLTVGRNEYSLDHADYRRIGSLGLELRHAADARTQVIAFGQSSEILYLQDGSQSYSSDQIIAGIGFVRTLEWSGNPLIFGSIYAGDDVVTRRRADGDRSLYGARIGIQRALRDDLDAFATFSLQQSNYKNRNILFQETRREAQYDLGIGLNWRFQPDWLFKPQLTYTRSDSNFQIYDYGRTEFSLTLRKDFR